MKYAIARVDGVSLLSGSSPLPEGAIHPIANWSEIAAVAYKYRKVVGSEVLEMSQAEKDVVDAAYVITVEDAQKYLDDTDWYIIREVDNGVECPQEIRDNRQAMRDLL